MSWQRNPPAFGQWVGRTRGPEDEVLWWAIWDDKAAPVMVRVFCRSGWMEDYGVFIKDTNWLARPADFAWWWHEPILPPARPTL